MLKKIENIKKVLNEFVKHGFEAEMYTQHKAEKDDNKTYRIIGTLEHYQELEKKLEKYGIQLTFGNKGRSTDTLTIYIQDHIEDIKLNDRRDLHDKVSNVFYLYDAENNIYGFATGFIGLNTEMRIQLFF